MAKSGAVVKKYGTKYMQKIGRKGGQVTLERYGTHYMWLLGSLSNPNLSEYREAKIRRQLKKIVQA